VDSAIAGIQLYVATAQHHMVALAAAYRLLVAIAGMHVRVSADCLQMLFSAAGFRMLAAIALAAVDRVRVAANNLAVAVHCLLEVVPYISPSMAAL
jgi:hypothetical protein